MMLDPINGGHTVKGSILLRSTQAGVAALTPIPPESSLGSQVKRNAQEIQSISAKVFQWSASQQTASPALSAKILRLLAAKLALLKGRGSKRDQTNSLLMYRGKSPETLGVSEYFG